MEKKFYKSGTGSWFAYLGDQGYQVEINDVFNYASIETTVIQEKYCLDNYYIVIDQDEFIESVKKAHAIIDNTMTEMSHKIEGGFMQEDEDKASEMREDEKYKRNYVDNSEID